MADVNGSLDFAGADSIAHGAPVEEELELLTDLLRRYHLLSAETRASLCDYPERFAAVLPSSLDAADPQIRYNCVEFLKHAENDDLLSLLFVCAADEDPHVSGRAVDAISLALSRRFHDSLGDDGDDLASCRHWCDIGLAGPRLTGSDAAFAAHLDAFAAALGVALGLLELHGQGKVVDALVSLGRRGDAVLLAELRGTEGRGNARGALLRELVDRPRAATAQIIVAMFASGSATLRRMAQELTQTYGACGQGGLLAGALQTMGAEASAAVVRQIRGIPWLDALGEHVRSLPDEMLLGWLDAITETRLDAANKLTLLCRIAESRREPVVARAFEYMEGFYAPLVKPLLLEYTRHEHESLRYHALSALCRMPSMDNKARLMARHLASDSRRIRAAAVKTVAAAELDTLCRDFDILDDQSRRLRAVSIRKADTRLLNRLSLSLRAADADERLKSLRVLSYTGVPEATAEGVIALAADPDRRVRAALPPLLVEIGSPEAARAVLTMLSDADGRVRANAVEAVERMGHSIFQKALIPLLASPNVRVRANAAKAMYTLGSPLALRILEAMLTHPSNATQRIAALWALANIAEPETLERARRAAREEHDVAVRERMFVIIAGAGTGVADKARAECSGDKGSAHAVISRAA